MRVVVAAIGALLLTALMAVCQTPTLIEALQGGTETVAGVSALPDVSSAPPGNIATGANKAEASAKAGRNTGLPDLFEDDIASSKSPDEAAYVADSARAKRLQASLVDRSNPSGNRAAEEFGETGDWYSIPTLAAVAPRGPGVSGSQSPDKAEADSVRVQQLQAPPVNRSFIPSGSRAPARIDTTAALAKIVSDPEVSAEAKIEAIEEVIKDLEEFDSTGELAEIVSNQEVSAEAKIEAIEEVIKDLEELASTEEPAESASDPDVSEDPKIEPIEEVAEAPAEPDPTKEPTDIVSDPDVPEAPEIEPIEEVTEAPAEPDPTEEPTEIVSDPDVPEAPEIEPIEEVVYTTAELVEALRDPNSDVYEMAADMLWDLDDPSVADAVWPMFEQYVAIDFDRAAVLLDLLDGLGQEVDEAYELLDYYDPTDWDAVVKQRQEEAAANGVCYAGMVCTTPTPPPGATPS